MQALSKTAKTQLIAEAWIAATKRVEDGRRERELVRYRFRPYDYVRKELGWTPWAGIDGQTGQVEVLETYRDSLLAQHDRLAFETGEISESELRYWRPGEQICNRIRIEAGHSVGKTKIAAGIVSHFFDTCTPSITYFFAPTSDQIVDLLWKEIKSDRDGKNLPGRLLQQPEIRYKADHFAKGRATSNSSGRGTERVQGQHSRYLMFVLDEAEGIDNYVWDALDSMTAGGISIVLMLANPRTRSSRFHKQKDRRDVLNFRMSCLYHPNVITGAELIPGAVRREYVIGMLDEHAEVVNEHDPDLFTFELPWQPGVIYRPDAEFLFRVLGIAPMATSDTVLIPLGRYEAAVQRGKTERASGTSARIGVDCARYGSDSGTIYCRRGDIAWRHETIYQGDSYVYYGAIEKLLRRLAGDGVTNVSIRVDGTGGFGIGVIDLLNRSDEMRSLFTEFSVVEVQFGSSATEPRKYADLATEMYGQAAESLKGLAVLSPPMALESDLTDRFYRWVNQRGTAVRALEDKETFRKRNHRSPDDGDGFVLSVAPDFLFQRGWARGPGG